MLGDNAHPFQFAARAAQLADVQLLPGSREFEKLLFFDDVILIGENHFLDLTSSVTRDTGASAILFRMLAVVPETRKEGLPIVEDDLHYALTTFRRRKRMYVPVSIIPLTIKKGKGILYQVLTTRTARSPNRKAFTSTNSSGEGSNGKSLSQFPAIVNPLTICGSASI